MLILSAVLSIAVLSILEQSILFYTSKFFDTHSMWYFFTGTQWSADALSGAKFGAVPLFFGTLMIALIAMAVAVPIGVMSAIYLSEFATPRKREIYKPTLEILSGIPTVVYGFFAAVTIAPVVVALSSSLGMEASHSNALSSGVVMGIMIIPIITSLSDDVIRAVPNHYRNGAVSLGLTKAEAIRFVVLPAASHGIIAAVLLGISRALGETMIVLMAAGMRPNMSLNPLDDMATITVTIVDAFSGDHTVSSDETLAAFALGFSLFAFTLMLNSISIFFIRRFQKRYQYSNL
ncbi:MAG: phosphate ABC transporter permease subunit PstC [Campylobacterales bacterium]|nr:phosphate ABC transporter permease subunit PstC [Campylobacterales bacterium]